ncbi:type I restriction enzyme S subunit [Frigoribacterium sp. PvP054]|uniref:restriction endonuclease subunit S n=1 Tax=Frigoribacterium sp. PvP054 TaxID=3156438 RepID=UPI003391D518
MTSGWTPTRLGEVVKIKHGFAFSGMAANTDSSLPVVVGIGNFDYAGGFRFGSTTIKRYVGQYPAEFTLTPGDVLLAMTCQTAGGEILGIPGTVPDDGQTYLHNQRLGKVEVLDPTRIDLRYFFQLARWHPFNRHLYATASGSKILHTSPRRIEDFAVDLPPLPEQQSIAAALSAVDDKIESNRRAIAAISDLLDAQSEKFGAGLPTVPLGAIATSVKDTVDPSKLCDAVVDHFSLPAFDSGARPEHVAAASIKSNKLRVPQQAVLLSRLNPRFNRTWWAAVEAKTATLASTEFLVLTSEDALELAAVWLAVRDPFFREELPKRVTGTSGSHQRVRPDDALAIEVPDFRSAAPEVKQSTLALLMRAESLRIESDRVTTLRDTLLPELLSGRRRSTVEGVAA